MLSTYSSIATLILFVIYFFGRVITILSVKKLWKDEVILDPARFGSFGIVDDITSSAYCGMEADDSTYGLLVSKEGIRNLSVFDVKHAEDGIPAGKGKCIFSRSFLNVNEAIAFHVAPGELFPTLIIEYTSFDFMKVQILNF